MVFLDNNHIPQPCPPSKFSFAIREFQLFNICTAPFMKWSALKMLRNTKRHFIHIGPSGTMIFRFWSKYSVFKTDWALAWFWDVAQSPQRVEKWARDGEVRSAKRLWWMLPNLKCCYNGKLPMSFDIWILFFLLQVSQMIVSLYRGFFLIF